ncbi:MAG: nicotinate-nucleotide adenylyltransferase [Candidatus Omnitrophota bacterium]
MKIGIFGGTFNPIHSGHLHAAREAARKLGISKVVLVVANTPPHKTIEGNATPEDRVAMARLAAGDEAIFEVSTYEIEKEGTSFSIDTIKMLKEKYGPDSDLYFITGADSLKDLSSWKDLDEILSVSTFVAATRPGYTDAGAFDRVRRIDIDPLDISSSDVRSRIRQGMPVNGLVPDAVAAYIHDKRLYGR